MYFSHRPEDKNFNVVLLVDLREKGGRFVKFRKQISNCFKKENIPFVTLHLPTGLGDYAYVLCFEDKVQV